MAYRQVEYQEPDVNQHRSGPGSGWISMCPAVQCSEAFEADRAAGAAGKRNTADISSGSIGKLDDAISEVLRFQAEVVAKSKRLEITKSRLEGLEINLQTLISKTEDIDVAEAIMQFKMQENAYRLALDTTARIIQPTLMDFLR